MMDEFTARAKIASVSEEDYKVIEKVYTFHPAMKYKQDIADIYTRFGMTVIHDMLPRAEKVEELERMIYLKQMDIVDLKKQIDELS